MHRLEFDNVQPVRQHSIRFPLQQVLRFVGCDVRHGCKNIRAMGRGPLDTIPVVDATFACLVIDVEVLQVVIEVDTSSAEVPTEERRMCCEYSRDIDMSFAAKWYGETCLPLVEVRDDGLVEFMAHILLHGGRS